MSPSSPRFMPSLDRLVEGLVEDAATRLRREENAERALLERQREASAEAAEVALAAARRLGAARAEFVRRSIEEAAERELHEIATQAADRFLERVRARLVLALGELPKTPERYEAALVACAKAALAEAHPPLEVRTAKHDRDRVYVALLAAGHEDFQVVGDPRVHVGFVVGDLDGRIQYDARPEGLVAARAADIAAWIGEVVAPFDPPAKPSGAR